MTGPVPGPADLRGPSPWREVFAALCRVAAARGVATGELAADLGVRSKDVNRWASDDAWSREPPPWAVRRVARRFGLAIVLRADEVLLVDDAQLCEALAVAPRVAS